MRSALANFNVRFVNLKFPRTSSKDVANFLSPLVMIDFINEPQSCRTCRTRMGVLSSDSRSLTIYERLNADGKKARCPITIEVPFSLIFKSAIVPSNAKEEEWRRIIDTVH